MANKDKAMHDQPGLEHHREITNTGGRMDDGDDGAVGARRATVPDKGEGPEKAGLKEGDDHWHNRANRSSEKSEGNRPMQGGNTPR